MLTTLTGPIHGTADPRLIETLAPLAAAVNGDPEYSFQAAAYRDGACVLDIWGGRHMSGDSIIVPYSVTKNTIGLSIALLVERGLLDLDERVAYYWPQFGAKGKKDVTVRMLLSHQAGLPQAQPLLTWDEILDHHAAAERLADTRPYWQPGSAFGYHAITIGNLADELVYRVSGRTLHEFYEQEIRRPHDIDFYLGLPEGMEGRRVPVLPMTPPVAPAPASYLPPLLFEVMGGAGPEVDLANDEASWRFGHPAGSGIGSARGLARLFAAAVTGVDGGAPFLSADTVSVVGQQQVRGYDEVLGQAHRSHSIVFQKPTPGMPFGGPRAFGHDGAQGCFAGMEPDIGLAFAYTVARGPWPGGADPRAFTLLRAVGESLAEVTVP